MNHLYLLIGTVGLLIVSILTTFVFCFWSVYLLDAIHRKWKFYKNELRCLQQGTVDVQQQTLAYNAKTELVKNILLFFLNLTEWLAFIIARMGYILYFSHEFSHHVANQSLHVNSEAFFSVLNITTGTVGIEISVYSFLFLADIFFVLSLVLVACLCMYLAARIARRSWIKSNRIPHLISFFLICCIVNQILASFCLSHIIADWFSVLLVASSYLIALKQYKKLQMVIGWTIADLNSCRKKASLAKQIKTKRKFSRLFTLIWAGFFLFALSQLLSSIMHTMLLIFRQNDTSAIDISLCKRLHFILPVYKYIYDVLFYVKFCLELLGNLFIFIPYVCHGLLTMCIVAWRRCNGKTGFRTRYNYGKDSPLIPRIKNNS